MKGWVKILFRSKSEDYFKFIVVFVQTTGYRYRYHVFEVTNSVIESYRVIVIEVTVIKRDYRSLGQVIKCPPL